MSYKKSASLTIFANFFINNEERLQRMKDSFKSFENINPSEWVINIRGEYKFEAGDFLENEIGDKLFLSYYNSGYGWFYDSRKIYKNITSQFVMYWIEDHILLAKPEILLECINEMDQQNVDQLWYSWYVPYVIEPFNEVDIFKEGKYIVTRKIDELACSKIRALRKNKDIYGDFCIVSAQSIMKKDFFKKILFSNKPYIKRRPRKTPYDFEKISRDNISNVIMHALPKQELFASIDDDLHHDGYSLMSRKLYQNRISRKQLKILEDPPMKIRTILKKMIPRKMKKMLLFIAGYFYRFFYTINIFWNK